MSEPTSEEKKRSKEVAVNTITEEDPVPWYHVRVPKEKYHLITDEMDRRKKSGEKYLTLTFTDPSASKSGQPEFIGIDPDD